MNNCSLRVLYPEHVQTSYESGSLIRLDGQFNDWQCEEMCEFIDWTSGNDFSEIADMGFCSDPKHSQVKEFLNKDSLDVCNSLNRTDITVSIVFASIFIVLICWCCQHKRYKTLWSKFKTDGLARCCGDNVPHTRQESNAELQTGNRGDFRPDLQLPREEMSTPTAPVTLHSIFGRGRAVTEPRVPHDDPPSYEDVVGYAKGLWHSIQCDSYKLGKYL